MDEPSTGILDTYALETEVRNPVYSIVDDLLDRKKPLGGYWRELRDSLKKLGLDSIESEIVARLATRAVDETLLHLRRFMELHTVVSRPDETSPDESAFEQSGMRKRTIRDTIAPDVAEDVRKRAQEDFGRHLVQQRNQVAARVREWIETDAAFPIPMYERLVVKVRQLDDSMRKDVASIALMMADEVVTGVLNLFSLGNDMTSDDKTVNYAIVRQARHPESDDVVEQIDIDRGAPSVYLADSYKRWLSRYAPSELRAQVGPTKGKK
jgi:hypothetical protein